MSKVMSVRVSDECAAWAASYAEAAGVKRQVLLENAVEGFRELCATGTPELRSFRDDEATADSSSSNEAPKSEQAPRREQARRVLAEVRRGPVVNERQRLLNEAKYGRGS